MTRFQWYGAFLIVLLLALTALGGTVRVTGSGLACPDWPGCYGSIVPLAEDYLAAGYEAHQVWLEWTHRLVAALTGLLIVVYAAIALLRHRSRRWVAGSAAAAVPLLALQGGLGALTVTEELEPAIVTAHLAVAMAIIFFVTVSWLAAFRHPTGDPGGDRIGDPGGGAGVMARWAAVAALLVYLLIIVGSYVTHTDAGYYCGNQWPLCNGDLWPDGRLAQWHMMHRLLAVIAAAAVAAVAVMAVRAGPRSRAAVIAAHSAAMLMAAQILLGAATMWTGLDEWARVAHLAGGAAMWTAASAAAVLAASRAGWIQPGAEAGSPRAAAADAPEAGT